jgi:hypothetical protein
MMIDANTMAIEIIMIFQTTVMIAGFLVLTLVYLSYVTELPECLFAPGIANYWMESSAVAEHSCSS